MSDDTDDDARPYVIQPRDTVLTIALMNEVEASAIREHPKNAAIFEELTRDEQMLAPGEMLYIPRPEPPTPTVVPLSVNRFVATVPWVHLHFAFESEAGPLSDEPFVIDGPAELLDEKRADRTKPLEGRLDAGGNLDIRVPALTPPFFIEFPERHIRHEVSPGGLDPVDQRTGLAARLLHLGYLPLDQALLEPYVFESEISERATLRSFQKAFLLEPSGFADPPTRAALIKEHGS